MGKSKDSNVSRKLETNSKGNRRGLSDSSKENLEMGRGKGGRTPGSVSLTTTLRHIITQEQADKIINDQLAIATSKPVPRERYTKDGQAYLAYDAVEVAMYEKALDRILERLDGKVTQPIGGDPARPLLFSSTLPGLGNVDK